MQERSSWRASELSKLMDLPPPKLRMAAIFWINQGRKPHLLFCSHDEAVPYTYRLGLHMITGMQSGLLQHNGASLSAMTAHSEKLQGYRGAD